MRLDKNNMKAAQQVREDYEDIRRHRSPFFLRSQEMLMQYNGDWSIPLPELEAMEKPAIANLIALGIDQTAMGIASVRPSVIFETLGNTDIAATRADNSRKAVLGWWDMNDWDLMTRRRARHLVAYGETVVSISPAPENSRDKRHIPHWKVRNPLSTFPAPCTNPDDMERDFVIFDTKKTLAWFQRKYPEKVGELFGSNASAIDTYDVLEYIDDMETLLVGIGSVKMGENKMGQEVTTGVGNAVVLERVTHGFGFCPVVIAGRITLDRIEGQYHQSLGIEKRRGTLDALNTIAIFRNIFAEEWAVSASNSGSSARIVKRANAKKNEIGIIDKGQLQIVRPPLNQEIGLALDRYESATRQAGVPAQYGGENPSNVRTARASNDLIGAAVDMNLQESQELIARSSEIEAYFAINIDKKLWGNEPKAFFFGKDGKIPHNDYTPNDTFVTDVCRVKYPMPGRDVNGMTVAFGQKHGIGSMSLQTIRELDPDIADAITEGERVTVENLERSLMTALEQGSAQGTMDPVKLARITKEVREGSNIIDAVVSVDDELKKEQAAQQNQQTQDQNAPQQTPADPNAQPGLGSGPEAPPTPGTPAAPAGKPSLQDLLGRLTGAPPEVQPNAVAQAPAPAPAGV